MFPPSLLPQVHRSTVRPQVVVFDPNVLLLEYIRENLGDVYNLHLFSEKASLWRELTSERKPDILMFSWEGAERSLTLLQQIMGQAGSIPVLVLACTPDSYDMRMMMNLGVRAVVLKPFDREDLERILEMHLRPAGPEAPFLMSPQKDVEIPLGDDRYFVRASPAMRALEQQARVIGASDIPVLVLGESGTGKEVLALFLHKSSSRNKETFLKVNCAAMPADLLESELFGYEQGAFTGAAKAKPGKFEICNGGTIFLDEIGEMPASLQAKLLHVLQDGTFTRLGGKTSQKVDVRVIAATNINIKRSIAEKSFREDLYYRLNGFSLTLPPLRERSEEIQLLADYFMRRAASKYNRSPLPFSQRMMQAMTEYTWPGNLRELENIVSRYLILGDEASILSELHMAAAPHPVPVATAAAPVAEAPRARTESAAGEGLKSLVKSLKGDAEAMAILEALEANRWNRKAAAKNLQISYKALLYKIKNYNLGATK